MDYLFREDTVSFVGISCHCGYLSSVKLKAAVVPATAVTCSRVACPAAVPALEIGVNVTRPLASEVSCTVCCASSGAGGHATPEAQTGVQASSVS